MLSDFYHLLIYFKERSILFKNRRSTEDCLLKIINMWYILKTHSKQFNFFYRNSNIWNCTYYSEWKSKMWRFSMDY